MSDMRDIHIYEKSIIYSDILLIYLYDLIQETSYIKKREEEMERDRSQEAGE